MKKWLMVIFGALLFIVLVVVVWELVYLKIRTKEEVYILPENFKGIVLIAYDQKEGLDDIKEDGKLIYKIPPSGILKLKRKEATTLSKDWYYFEDKQGKRTEFNYCFPPCNEMKKNPNKSFAYGSSNGVSLDGDHELCRTIFLIGTANDTDSLSKVAEKINVIEAIQNNVIKATISLPRSFPKELFEEKEVKK